MTFYIFCKIPERGRSRQTKDCARYLLQKTSQSTQNIHKLKSFALLLWNLLLCESSGCRVRFNKPGDPDHNKDGMVVKHISQGKHEGLVNILYRKNKWLLKKSNVEKSFFYYFFHVCGVLRSFFWIRLFVCQTLCFALYDYFC